MLQDGVVGQDGLACETVVPIAIAPGRFRFAALFRGPERNCAHPLLGTAQVRPFRDNIIPNSATINPCFNIYADYVPLHA